MEAVMMYTETITRDGETTVSAISDAGALATLRRGKRLGVAVTATPDGTITIVRTVLHLAGEDVTETQVIVTLTPDAKPVRLTKTQYEDLQRIRHAGKHAQLLPEGSIRGILCRIPPATAKRLFDRGFAITTDAEGRVEISIAGLLAMAAYEHPARTTRPRGWHSPSDRVQINTPRVQRMHPYQTNDRTSAAVCTCGFHRTLDERTYAVVAKNGHLADALTAALTAAA
jgi:hypothetical protein